MLPWLFFVVASKILTTGSVWVVTNIERYVHVMPLLKVVRLSWGNLVWCIALTDLFFWSIGESTTARDVSIDARGPQAQRKLDSHKVLRFLLIPGCAAFFPSPDPLNLLGFVIFDDKVNELTSVRLSRTR